MVSPPHSGSNATQGCRPPRYPFYTTLEIEWGSTVLKGRVCDIGSEGMFVELPDPLWVGASFSAQLVVGKLLRVDCVVRWVDPGRGMGVSIVVPGAEGRKQFEGFLQALAQK